ncbi:MAG: glycogen/starch synthase [Oscillospiraceae bacterium]|nr:glycogen/starch synthase [Oscillospiraceae bacterium]
MPTKKNESSKEPKKAPLAIEKEEKKAAPAKSRKKAEPKPENETAAAAVKEVPAAEPVKEVPAAEPVKEAVKAVKKAAAKAVKKAAEPAKEEAVADAVKEPAKAAKKAPAAKPKAEAAKPAPKKAAAKKPAAKKPVKKSAPAAEAAPEEVPAVEVAPVEEPVVEVTPVEAVVEEVPAAEPTVEEAAPAEPAAETEAEPETVEVIGGPQEELPQPRRSVAFIGSECYPFVKTGGLGDVMYALPRALTKQNCDVKVILPRYKCIPWEYQEKMVYRGAFSMNLCSDGRSFYVGIMEYVWDGVVYDFIDNDEFFSWGNPYTNLVDDIPKYCYFDKAALAALNYLDWVPDVIHCHDWQTGLVPLYLRTQFAGTPVGRAKVMMTIHNLRFQGVYNIPTIKYWSGLDDWLFNIDVLKQNYVDANMFKGGLAFADMITTVSGTYAGEIQTPFFGEGLDAHLRHHSYKLRGIVNGIDCDIWNSKTDSLLAVNYDLSDVLAKKRENKRALQERLGLEVDEGKFVIGLISRLTDQKGLDLVNAILPQIIDGNTQVVVLGTGDARYEDSFRYYENAYKGSVCSNIMYDESRAHQIYAGADALLVPSLFEPCGLTQLIAMRYGTVPIVRETGGLKDTVQPYNQYTDDGNGFTFDRYETGLLLDAINRAKTVYFTDRWRWDEMVQRDMAKDVSWENSAKQYRALYLELRP